MGNWTSILILNRWKTPASFLRESLYNLFHPSFLQLSVPVCEKHPHSMTLPSPCFAVKDGVLSGMRGVRFASDPFHMFDSRLAPSRLSFLTDVLSHSVSFSGRTSLHVCCSGTIILIIHLMVRVWDILYTYNPTLICASSHHRWPVCRVPWSLCCSKGNGWGFTGKGCGYICKHHFSVFYSWYI